jgi:hypothetical protein
MTFLGLISKFEWEIGRKANLNSIYGQSKDGLISETFSCWPQSPKNVPKPILILEHLLFRLVDRVIWHIFCEIAAKVKNIL